MSFAIPDSIKSLAGLPGPFATAYLDITRSSEHGSDEVALRWNHQRAELNEAGADEATLAALDAAAGAHTDIGGPRGQVLVASGGTVHFDRTLAAPPVRDWVSWSPLPHVLAYLARREPAIGYVLLVADRTGADVTAYTADEAAEATLPRLSDSVRGSSPYPIHETGRDEWDERHFQNRVQNSWQTNAKDVAAEAARIAAAASAELIVLAGDLRARSLLRTDLADALPPGIDVTDVAAGGRASGASAHALGESVRDALLRHAWRQRHEVLTHLRNNVGRGEFAVTGVEDVISALRRSQVDTVVLSDDPSSPLTAWVGPQPLELATNEADLRDLGVEHPQQDRFDAALVRAAAGSDAQLVITPNAHDYLRGGVAALLRYADPATPKP
jgi:hypothetical protein